LDIHARRAHRPLLPNFQLLIRRLRTGALRRLSTHVWFCCVLKHATYAHFARVAGTHAARRTFSHVCAGFARCALPPGCEQSFWFATFCLRTVLRVASFVGYPRLNSYGLRHRAHGVLCHTCRHCSGRFCHVLHSPPALSAVGLVCARRNTIHSFLYLHTIYRLYYLLLLHTYYCRSLHDFVRGGV